MSCVVTKQVSAASLVQDKFGWDRPILMLMLWTDGTHLDAAGRHKVEVVMACWGKQTSHMLSQLVAAYRLDQWKPPVRNAAKQQLS